MINKIDTKKLIIKIINRPLKTFEVRLIINSSFCATHFIYTIDSISLIDEGIDGEERDVLLMDFLDDYKNKFWQIDQIV